jgi:hypothetical protein
MYLVHEPEDDLREDRSSTEVVDRDSSLAVLGQVLHQPDHLILRALDTTLGNIYFLSTKLCIIRIKLTFFSY